jgi:hypothetical protein
MADHVHRGEVGLYRATSGPSAERAWQEVLLVDGGENLGRAALERPVTRQCQKSVAAATDTS